MSSINSLGCTASSTLIKITNNSIKNPGSSYTIQIPSSITKPKYSFSVLVDLTFKDIDDLTIRESHSEYILLTPTAISSGDNTKLLGSYSSFQVKTVLNINFVLPSALAGYSAVAGDP